MLSLLQRWQIGRFFSVGALATLLHSVLFVALIEWLGMTALSASVVAFSGAFMVSYLLNHRWTFEASGRHHFHLPRFALVGIGGLLLNMGIVYLVVDVGHYSYLLALLLVVTVVPLLSYLMNRHWVFGNGA